MKDYDALIPLNRTEKIIFLIRGQKALPDRDVAALYGVETSVLNQAVRRNQSRFPADFMFALTCEEIRNISQIVICAEIKDSRRIFAFIAHQKDLNEILRPPTSIQLRAGLRAL